MKKVAHIQQVLLIAASLFFSVAAQAQTVSFQDFVKQFPSATLPFSLGEQELRAQLEQRAASMPVEKAKRLAWEYYEFLPDLEDNARTNRMPVYPEPVAVLETKEYTAVVYNTGRTFARQYKTYNIAVFGKDGKYIASRCIGGVNPNVLASVAIDENLQVTIKEYQVNWTKDVTTSGIEGNRIAGLSLLNTRTVDATTSVKGENEDWMNRPLEMTQVENTLTAQTK